MLPQTNEQLFQKDDSFAFRLEMLKKELDFIDGSIRKIDDIGNSIKNWAILSWTGSIAIILGKPELYGYVAFSAIPQLQVTNIPLQPPTQKAYIAKPASP